MSGLLTGALALGWQVAEYLLSGGRVAVAARSMKIVYPGAGSVLPPEDVLEIETRVGRQPVAVTFVGLHAAQAL